MTVKEIIEGILVREAEFVDNPDDRGGPTRWGITEVTARHHGYQGDIRDLPRDLAERIYVHTYYLLPGFDKVGERSNRLAEELTDTGVNMGVEIAAQFLQRCLNVFNRKQELWVDIQVDGRLGTDTLSSLDNFLKRRGLEGEEVLLKALNCLQGARYVKLAELRERDESFVYGWIRSRVSL